MAGQGSAAQGSAAQGSASGPAGLRLTGRGALVVMFALFFLGLVFSDLLGWGLLTGGAFVAGCVLAAARTQRSDLLSVAVSPPALFLAAVICGKALTSSGGLLLSTTEGTLITLANTAPWLIVGTILGLAVAFSRGLWGNIRTLSEELHSDPVKAAARARAAAAARPLD